MRAFSRALCQQLDGFEERMAKHDRRKEKTYKFLTFL